MTGVPGGNEVTSSRGRRPRRARLAAVTCALVFTLPAVAACTSDDPLAQRARDSGDRNVQVGEGGIEAIAADRRGAPVDLHGTLLDGKPWSRDRDAAGKVVVVNVWASWCGPCEAEAPRLVAAAKDLTARHRDVTFLGIDTGEGPETGRAAAERHGLLFPSLSDLDRAAGTMLQGKVNTPPATLVLDRQGRIAARINGELTSPTTLKDLVDDVVAEKA